MKRKGECHPFPLILAKSSLHLKVKFLLSGAKKRTPKCFLLCKERGKLSRSGGNQPRARSAMRLTPLWDFTPTSALLALKLNKHSPAETATATHIKFKCGAKEMAGVKPSHPRQSSLGSNAGASVGS